MTPGLAETDAGQIAYEVLDCSAPWRPRDLDRPIVFQHGLGLSREVWRPWLQHLSGQRRVVCVDLRGHGGSAAAWTEPDYPLARFASDVLEVLDDLAIDDCHFIGESFGGTLGIHLASVAPRRIASLTICSTAYRGQSVANVAHWPQLVREQGVEAWSEEILGGRFAPGTVGAELIEWVRARQRALAPEVVAGVIRCLLATDLEAKARGLRTPLLILAPSDSPFVDVTPQIDLNRLVTGSEIAFLRNGLHGIVMSHWRECSAAAALFIGRVDAAVER